MPGTTHSPRAYEERAELELRFVTSVEDPSGTGYTERSFVVENGRVGATSTGPTPAARPVDER